MKYINVIHGYRAIVDDEDYGLANIGGWRINQGGYAITDKIINGERKIIDMHLLIHPQTVGFVVDHINQNKLDNRRSNLRDATKSINALNSKIPTTNKSGYKGVSWHGGVGKWRSTIQINGKQHHLGFFYDREEASGAYQSKLMEVLA